MNGILRMIRKINGVLQPCNEISFFRFMIYKYKLLEFLL